MSTEVKSTYPVPMGRKLPDPLEHPATVHTFLKGCDLTVEQFNAAGLSPNDITVLASITSLVTFYCIATDRPRLAAVFFLIAYFFDCADGVVARRFNQCTTFGDKFEHARDWITFAVVFLLIELKYPMNKYWLALLAVAFVGTAVHMGLAEGYTTECMAVEQPGNMLRICMYISRHFEPKKTLAKEEFCANISKTMQISKFGTDVNIILILALYLFTR